MGYTPDQVRAMSLYDWACVSAGFIDFHHVDEEGELLSTDEVAMLSAQIDTPPPWLN